MIANLTFKPATPETWDDLETLFRGCDTLSGCWCMWWRIKRTEFQHQGGEGNRQALRAIVEAGEIPGILAYVDERPVGWVSVAPRESFPVLDRSPTLKRVDDQPVWSIVCFYVDPPLRGEGMTEALLQAAIEHARAGGATIVEAYPAIPANSANPDTVIFTGTHSTFVRAGFQEVARRSEIRPVMRYTIGE
ncbi:MAG: GNAT family N-acetyltransferase [Anaerolineae bacterium]|nr:GNAT family N-acetyltransferase [Anaerolineae bacterium]